MDGRNADRDRAGRNDLSVDWMTAEKVRRRGNSWQSNSPSLFKQQIAVLTDASAQQGLHAINHAGRAAKHRLNEGSRFTNNTRFQNRLKR